MNDWLHARTGWTLLLIYWAVVLAAALIGTATVMLLHHPAGSFAPRLPWVIGGSLFVALVGTGGTLRRRRQEG